MTLELLRHRDDFFEANRNPKPYTLGGVEKITCNTEYGNVHRLPVSLFGLGGK